MSPIVVKPRPPAELPDRDLERVTAGKNPSTSGAETAFGPRRIVDDFGARRQPFLD
jgi:hypothetical protein